MDRDFVYQPLTMRYRLSRSSLYATTRESCATGKLRVVSARHDQRGTQTSRERTARQGPDAFPDSGLPAQREERLHHVHGIAAVALGNAGREAAGKRNAEA